MIYFSKINGNFWLSYEYFATKGIHDFVIERWKERKRVERTYVNGRAYINYDTIPAPTRAKLPTKEELKKEYNRQQYKHIEDEYYKELKYAYASINTRKWHKEIREHELYGQLNIIKIVELSRRASVIERILELHECYGYNNLASLHNAFNRVYPEQGYKNKDRFSKMISKATKEGVLSVAIDKRIFHQKSEKFTDEHKYYAFYTLNHNKNYTIKNSYKKFTSACHQAEIDVPSWHWFRLYYRDNKNLLSGNRDKKPKSVPIYAKIIPALYSGNKWNLDGWTIPIFCKRVKPDGSLDYYFKYTLFAVMDEYSRKIIGCHVAESENTETILKGLEKAVKATNSLPFEITADNHSFNKTKEAGNLKDDFTKRGVHWTVDSNPRRKGTLERAFRTIGDNHFKEHYGYIGQGIRTRIRNGITQQELLDIYKKPANLLTEEQVIAIAHNVVNEYNDTVIESLKDTPNNLYENSEKPNLISIDVCDRVAMFIRRSEATVRSGQITIQRGMHKYEYQLPAKYYTELNNKKVGIRYPDFEEIYLYDIKTDMFICSVPQKITIHGALADQTDNDKHNLYKFSGRVKGIKSKQRKAKEKLTESAHSINPNAYGYINPLTTSKDVIAKIRKDSDLRNSLFDYDINPDTIPDLPEVNEMLDTSMRPKEAERRNPFHRDISNVKL